MDVKRIKFSECCITLTNRNKYSIPFEWFLSSMHTVTLFRWCGVWKSCDIDYIQMVSLLYAGCLVCKIWRMTCHIDPNGLSPVCIRLCVVSLVDDDHFDFNSNFLVCTRLCSLKLDNREKKVEHTSHS